MYIYLVHSLFREKMTHSDLTEDLTASKEKGEEIQAAQAGPAVTDQVSSQLHKLFLVKTSVKKLTFN